MKKYIVLILFGLSFVSFAQESFLVKTEGSNDFNLPSEILIKPDGNMLFLVNSIDEIDNTYAGDIHEVNLQGEVMQRITFDDSAIRYPLYYGMLNIEDTLYVIGCGETDDASELPMILMHKLDMQLNILASYANLIELSGFKKFQMGAKYIYNGSEIEGFGGFGFGSSGGRRPFFIQISKTGEVLRLIEDNDSNGVTLFNDYFNRPSDDGYNVFHIHFNDPNHTSGTYLYQYNKQLGIENRLLLPNNLIGYMSVLPIDESTFYLSALYLEFFGITWFRLGLRKMQTDGTVLDEFMYDMQGDTAVHPAYEMAIDTCQDGSIILCGINNLKNQLIHQSEPASILLFKLNKNLDVKWQRYIGADDGKYDAFSVQVTPEDDIVVLGAFDTIPVTNLHYNRPMFIRTNSDGLITGLIEPNSHFYSKEAIVYPNPTRNFVTVDFSMAYPNALFTLRDISGKVVLESRLSSNRQEVDISELAPGAYVYSIYNSKGLNESGKLVVE